MVLFVVLGWLSPWPPVLWTHLIFLPLMVLHWKTNDDQCILTQLESGLRDEVEAPEPDRSPFIASMIMAVTGKRPNENVLNQFIYVLVFLSFCLSAWRLVQPT